MDGREAMAFTGPHTPFYFPRGAFSSISAVSQGANALHAPPGMRPMLNPNMLHPLANSSGQPFPFVDQRNQEFGHNIHMGMAAASSAPIQQPSPAPTTELSPAVVNKKKRGRPRKYAPDGQVALGLSPMSSYSKPKSSSSMSDPNGSKRGRGRPPGTGRKQRLANLGEWMNTSAGLAFAPHVISVEAGEDIVSKILSFSQQRPRALCIMSATGTVSSVTLRQPASTIPSISFEGSYAILSLAGSYLVNEETGSKNRTGGISVSLSTTDGHIIGGGAGILIAASIVQVVACSFVHGSGKVKVLKQENGSKEESLGRTTMETEEGWGGGGRVIESRDEQNLNDIDLTSG